MVAATPIKKRVQHYVWRYYLKPWASNGSIYCLHQGKVSLQPLRRVAYGWDYYKPQRLTAADLLFLRSLVPQSTPTDIQRTSLGWIETFALPFKVADIINASPLRTPEDTEYLEATLHNFEEDLHALIERGSIKHLDALRKQDASFFTSSDADAADFLHYLAIQHLRTPGTEDAVLPALSAQQGEQFVRVWKVLRHIYATNIAGSIYLDRGNWAFVFLGNDTIRSFLTGDQPTLNSRAMDAPLGDGLDDLEFYYPLSPTLAVLLTRNARIASGTRLQVSLEDVDRYNRYIVRSSHRQVFSESKELLNLVASGLYS